MELHAKIGDQVQRFNTEQTIAVMKMDALMNYMCIILETPEYMESRETEYQ